MECIQGSGLRSNNFAEGHNHAFGACTITPAGRSHPGIELQVDIPPLYSTDAKLDIQQTLSATALVPHRKKKYADLDLKYHQT